MNDADRIAVQFFARFFTHFPIAHTSGFLPKLITLSHELNYAPPLHALIEAKEQERAHLSAKLEPTTLGTEGMWLTLFETEELNLGYDTRTLEQIITRRHPESFSSRDRICASPAVREYYVSYENVSLIDKGGTAFVTTKLLYHQLRSVRAELEVAKGILRDLETRCASSEASVLAPHPVLKPTPDAHLSQQPEDITRRSPPADRGVSSSLQQTKMDTRQLVEAGSKYDQLYLSIKIHKNKERFGAEKKGRKWYVTVTPENYHLLGLKTFPTPAAPATLEDARLLTLDNSDNAARPQYAQLARPYDTTPDVSVLGTRMSIADIKAAGSSFKEQRIYITMRQHRDVFYTYKTGNKIFAVVNGQNYHLLGLPAPPPYAHESLPTSSLAPLESRLQKLPSDTSQDNGLSNPLISTPRHCDKPEARTAASPSQEPLTGASQKPISVNDLNFKRGRIIEAEIGGRVIHFSTGTQYASAKVLEFLRQIHSEVFTNDVAQHVVQQLQGGRNYVSGEALVPFLEKTAGMMLLDTSSTHIHLANLLDIPAHEAETYFIKEPFVQFVRHYPEITPRSYILKREMLKIKQAFDNYTWNIHNS